MEVVHQTCCGIDVHQAILTACVRKVKKDGAVQKVSRDFDTKYDSLLSLLEWLTALGCKVVAMESTGVYWKPVYHILSAQIEVIIGNSADMKRPNGKNKTDRIDADWISELLAHGLIRPSFIPPPEICALRDLTRMRVTLVQSRTQHKNRVHKVLEDTNIKLSSVASDIFGKSGRNMLNALISGKKDPKLLSQMAKGVMRRKIPVLELALKGRFTDHHGSIIKMSLASIDLLNSQIAELDERIRQLIDPMLKEVEQIMSIPGVSDTATRTIVSEIGINMSHFGSPGRLCAWSGLAPGNRETAGKRKSGRTPKGNRYIRRVLVQCAWATRKTNSFLGNTFKRLEKRIGGKKAAIAVARKILVIIYHLLNEGTFYDEERYNNHNAKLEEKYKRNAIKTLERLGFQIELKPAA